MPKTTKKKPRPTVAALAKTVKALQHAIQCLEARENAVVSRLYTVERETDKLIAHNTEIEAVSGCPALGEVMTPDGRLVYWMSGVKITDMTDSHLKNALGWLRAGRGAITDDRRHDLLIALTFEAGRRAGKKGL